MIPRFDSLVSWLLRHFVALTAVIGLISYVAVYTVPFADFPVRSDGFSYFVYLPNWLLYRDVSLESVARECCEGTYPEFSAMRRWPSTGRWLNPHPIGVALLTWPFFLVAHLLTRLTNLPDFLPPDGLSLFYQHLAGLAGLAYLLGGLAIVRRVLVRHFASGVALAALVTVTWGTNLFHYGVYDSGLSHVYSFFLIAALIALNERWWANAGWGVSVALALVAGVMVSTRHTNALYALIVPLYGVNSFSAFRANLEQLSRRRTVLTVMAAVFLLTIAPQLAIYRYATGRWLVSPYSLVEHAGFSFASPHLWGVLFGLPKGLFFWSPALLLAVAGVVVATGWAGRLRLPAVAIFVIDAYLIASWYDWQLGGSYGHRGFTDGLALAAIFLAATFEWAARRPRWMVAVSVGASLAVALSVVQMIQYWLKILPISDVTWTQYQALFLRFH